MWENISILLKKGVKNLQSKHNEKRGNVVQIPTADKPEENMAAKSALSLTQSKRTVSDRGFVLGVAVRLWGSIGLDSRSLGLWSRKRPRQEVRASLNSLEMLYHHYQQGTVSHRGHKTLRVFRVGCLCVCVCEWLCFSEMCHYECINSVWQILPCCPGCFAWMWILLGSSWQLWRPQEQLLLLLSFALPNRTRFKWSNQRGILGRGKMKQEESGEVGRGDTLTRHTWVPRAHSWQWHHPAWSKGVQLETNPLLLPPWGQTVQRVKMDLLPGHIIEFSPSYIYCVAAFQWILFCIWYKPSNTLLSFSIDINLCLTKLLLADTMCLLALLWVMKGAAIQSIALQTENNNCVCSVHANLAVLMLTDWKDLVWFAVVFTFHLNLSTSVLWSQYFN